MTVSDPILGILVAGIAIGLAVLIVRISDHQCENHFTKVQRECDILNTETDRKNAELSAAHARGEREDKLPDPSGWTPSW